ncbi:MAG: indolepyruvate ferredoxin oxidoreductase family protein [Pseudomonadales bacterium]|nr:indolepyruvate ferredoxin oxidoreductase family protein [Pseudomonadales bacterium]
MSVAKVTLDDKYTQQSGRVFLNGNQALARLPMLQQERDRAAGLNTAGFISGYRGSPLGGLDKTLWQAKAFLNEHHIHFQPGVNEDLAATSVWGSQQVNLFEGARFDGIFSMWYGKGPGVDRSGDVFKHANHAGTSPNGGVLVIAGDDHGCKSSTLPHQSEYAFVDAMIPVLNPAGVQELIDFGLHGWAMSRFSGCWVAMKTIAETVDASFSTDVSHDRIRIVKPDYDNNGVHITWPDKPLDQELRLHHLKLGAALAYAKANQLNHITLDTPNPRLGIVSTGKSWLDVLQALEDLGIDQKLASEIGLRVFKVGMSWPLETSSLRHFAEGLDEVLVVEEKRGLIEDQLTSQLYNWHTEVRPVVVGKHDEQGNWLLPATGELTPAVIARVIAARIGRFFTSERIEKRLAFLNQKEQYLKRPKNLIERTPHFCSGCPHNTSTRVPDGSRAMAGIGCHYMANWMERETHTFTQMGGEGATWIGQAPFTETRHVFQNLGDGTYFHSGLLAIRAAIASGINITYKILYNDAVAMTGGQPVDGQLSVDQMAQQVSAEGISALYVVSDDIHKYERGRFPEGTVFMHRDDLEAVQVTLRETAGTTIIIYDQTCAAEKRRRRKKGLMTDPKVRAFINTEVCEGCGDCGIASNCLSIAPDETEYGRKRKIEQSSCNKDMSCLKGFCPALVTVTGGEVRTGHGRQLSFDVASLPAPVLPLTREPYRIVLAGVGGTGVTTLGAILGMAAHLENKGASLLDMTGLAQKFGAVITHLQIADDAGQIHAARIAAGGADVIIGCDLVVAASNDSLVKAEAGHTRAVINDHHAMTADFTRDPDAVFPEDSMKHLISESLGSQTPVFLNASGITEQLLGDTTAQNLLLAGYAYQAGLIPLSQAAICQAIELNGAAVSQNLLAFNTGRYLFINPNAVTVRPETISRLANPAEIIADRAARLRDYQNQALADRYVFRMQAFELALARKSVTDEELIATVARNYYKLLAYKDEYEVARLYTSPAFRTALQEQFEGPVKLSFHLAPPLLAPRDKVSGKPRKLTFGSWLMPAFSMLRRLRFLRGTVLDPFGYTRDRQLDKQLITEYEMLMDFCLQHIDTRRIAGMREVMNIAEEIRGYGHIREANADRARAKLDTLKRKLTTTAEVVRLVNPKAA